MLLAVSEMAAKVSQPWVKTARKPLNRYLSQNLSETSGKGKRERKLEKGENEKFQ